MSSNFSGRSVSSCVASKTTTEGDQQEDAELEAAREDTYQAMRAALEAVEWVDVHPDYEILECPWCEGRDTMRSRVMTFRASPEEAVELRKIAEENGLPTASMIRLAIGTFVSDYREAGPPSFLSPPSLTYRGAFCSSPTPIVT
jgi:hypothetical protein